MTFGVVWDFGGIFSVEVFFFGGQQKKESKATKKGPKRLFRV